MSGRTTEAADVRVVVVDDHPFVRDGLRALLSTVPGFAMVGEAGDGVAALAVVRESQPDVVLLDLAMPRLDGLETLRRLKADGDPPAVLILTMSDDAATVAAAMKAGADGYLLKDADQEDVLAALAAAARGQVVLSPAVAQSITGLIGGSATPLPELSERERQVLDLVAAGLGNQAVARRLGVSPKTVANVLSGILVKLGVRDRADAIARARESGLGSSGLPGTASPDDGNMLR